MVQMEWGWLRKGAAAAATFVFFLGLDSYLYAVTQDTRFPIYPLYWLAALFLAGAAGFIVDLLRGRYVVSAPVAVAALLFTTATVAWLGTPPSMVADQVYDTYVLAALFIGALAALYGGTHARAAAHGALVVAVIVAVALNWIDIAGGGPFTKSFPRAAGTYIDANGAAAAIALGGVATIHRVGSRWRGAYVGLVLAGVLLTGSRMGIGALTVGFTVLLMGRLLRWKDGAIAVLMTIGLLGMLAWVSPGPDGFAGWWYGLKVRNAALGTWMEQWERESAEVVPETPKGSLPERWAFLLSGFRLWLATPWSGSGLGSEWAESYYATTIPAAGSHNGYVTAVLHFGVTGVALVGLAFLCVARATTGKGEMVAAGAMMVALGMIAALDNDLWTSRPKMVVWALWCSGLVCTGQKQKRAS